MLRVRLCASMVCAIVGVGAGHAAAATITVNTTADDSSAGDGFCSLRKAIADVDAPGSNSGDCAPAAFGTNTIQLGPHTYTLFGSGGAASSLEVTSSVTDLTIVGAGESATQIEAGGSGQRLLAVDGGATVTLGQLTLSGGHAPDGTMGTPGLGAATGVGGDGGAGAAGANGGGILNGGVLTVIDAAVTNSAAGDGGAGGVGGSSTAGAGGVGGAGGTGGAGGAIFNTGILTLRGATISGNRAGDGGAGAGGGIGGEGDGGAGGSGGASGDGGGVSNDGGTVYALLSTINGNLSGNGGPGGLGGQGSATAGAGGPGGAASGGGGLSDIQGGLIVTNTTFASDAAGNGGAGGAGGTGRSANGDGGGGGAAGNGGAVSIASPAGASLLNVTMAGNNSGTGGPAGTGATGGAVGAAGAGGGVFAQGSTASLENSLLFRNGGGNCSASIVDGGHNLSFPATGCPATFAGGDPNLGPLQDNGGPTRTISLQPGSAALDQVPATGASCPATDQRGVPRPGAVKCDIGAYEAAAPTGTTGPAISVSRRAATLTATVRPNSGDAGVVFQFGTSAKLGSQTKVQQLDGVSPMPVAAVLGGLKPNTTYHYRVEVASQDGSAVGTERTFTTSSNPSLKSVKIKPSRFKAAGQIPSASTGATISYTDSQAATTRFSVLAPQPGVVQGHRCVAVPGHGNGRAHHACTRYVKVGSFTHKDLAGSNAVRLSGRAQGRKLAPGRYRLLATPRSPGHTGRTVTATFTIVR